MSVSVATPMAGLLNYDFGPDNMPDFTATDFSDHMELDRSAGLQDGYNHHEASKSPDVPKKSRASVENDTNSEEQKQALGNLLGALIPNQNLQSGDGTDFANVETDNFTVEERQMINEQLPPDNQGGYDNARLPSFDATAANEIFSNEDFSNLSHNMTMPLTPSGQNMHNIGMGHFRQDSFASQGSIPRGPATPQRREFEAFARLQFEDGSYYLNTYACELGRDVLAYRAALQKEREEKEAELNENSKSRSSSGRASHHSSRMRRQLGSQMQGSVVSEQGGFAGIDEAPMRPPQNPEKPTMSSQESESSVVKPAEYLINPRTMPSFDYHRSTEMQAQWVAQEEYEGEAPDDEQPAAVTAAHLPNPHMCPLIPIHGRPMDGQTDAELHKKISRRHVKIQWSFGRDCWEMKVQGRNGAFCNGRFVRWKGVVPLHDGAVIQIAHVVLTFCLPKTAQQQEQEAQAAAELEIDADNAIPSVESRPSESVADDEQRETLAEQKATPKISLKFNQKVEPPTPELPLGPDGVPIPKRRGPGRPPKDGIMSTRERKEREKAAKAAAAREANGGKTPPPSMRTKMVKSPPLYTEEAKQDIKQEVRLEKRKYTKRKGTDENGNPLPDIDGDGVEGDGESDGEPKTKKARTQKEKSESPEYPPRESLTAEQLARPPDSYAVLLHKILCELYPRALPLKDIYRELKKRYPWYVYEATTEGWQSSVRHNLNSEFGKLFDKGDKEGKGFAWRAIPDAQLPQTEKKRTTQATAQRPRPPQQRPQFAPLPGQSVQWQGTGAFPANENQQPSTNRIPWPPPGQNFNWQPNGTPHTGTQQPGPSATGATQQSPHSQTPQPGAAPTQTGSISNGSASNMNTSQPTAAPVQPIPPTAPVSSSAASNMPCTLGGIEAIKRFEQAMYGQLMIDQMVPEKKEFWQGIFASAKKRVLHGYTASTTSKGDTKEEATIMLHMQTFVDKFKNPNFKGFTPRIAQHVGSDEPPAQFQATPPVHTSPAPSSSTISPNTPTATVRAADSAQPPDAIKRESVTADVASTSKVPRSPVKEQSTAQSQTISEVPAIDIPPKQQTDDVTSPAQTQE